MLCLTAPELISGVALGLWDQAVKKRLLNANRSSVSVQWPWANYLALSFLNLPNYCFLISRGSGNLCCTLSSDGEALLSYGEVNSNTPVCYV